MIGAKYTVVLADLLKSDMWKEEINKALSEYPMYEKKLKPTEWIPTYIPTREQLNKKILDHFKYREIGVETPARFVDELRITMNEIMPYYCQLFFSTDQDYNLLYNVDYTKTHKLTRDDTSESTTNSNTTASDSSSSESSNTSNNKSVKVDTPQDELSIGTKNINNLTYASEMGLSEDIASGNTETNGSSTGTSTSTGEGKLKSVEEYTEDIKGNYGQVSFQALLEHYRKLIINVEQELLRDDRLQELFMQVY